ncbi:MAG: hypothetical protein H0V56_02370 [Chthoniobacterales bacterium]|nr:hypothetical protein [Chthoniobacterales bacterium]
MTARGTKPEPTILLSACGAGFVLADIKTEVAKRQDEAVKRSADWIKQVSIATENRGFPEGAEHMAQTAREAGFQRVEIVQTKAKLGVFATLDAVATATATS